jgi:hypothetical protein
MLQSVAISAGVGKTHIVQARGRLAVHGAETRFFKTSRVLARLASGQADRTWGKRLRELTRPAVLILGDFGMRDLTAAQARRPLQTDHRAVQPLAHPDEQPSAVGLVPLFPHAVVAESLLDRLIKTSHQAFMSGA